MHTSLLKNTHACIYKALAWRAAGITVSRPTTQLRLVHGWDRLFAPLLNIQEWIHCIMQFSKHAGQGLFGPADHACQCSVRFTQTYLNACAVATKRSYCWSLYSFAQENCSKELLANTIWQQAKHPPSTAVTEQ